jgi:hypothetical protein
MTVESNGEAETPISELFGRDPLQQTLTPQEVQRVVEKFRGAAALFAAGLKPEPRKRAAKSDPTLLDF